MVSRRFMKGYAMPSEVGDFTFFNLKLCVTDLRGYKIHTIRNNYDYWNRIVNEVNEGRAVLSVRQWRDIPYRSKQQELCKFEKLGIQKISIDLQIWPKHAGVGEMYKSIPVPLESIAPNDGLRVDQFKAWFPKPFEGCIIHFTDFRY